MAKYSLIASVRWDDQYRPHLVVLTLPLVTKSEANSRDHWAVKARRVKEQRSIVGHALRMSMGEACDPAGGSFHLTRYGKKMLDSDNLTSAFKGCRDQIAEWVGIDDGDSRLKFTYGQQVSRELGIQIAGELVYKPIDEAVSRAA